MIDTRFCFLRWIVMLVVASLAACSSAPQISSKPIQKTDVKTDRVLSSVEKSSTPNPARGGYYQDDGPGENIPANLETTPDPVPAIEPYSRTGNKPYQVFGKTYTPLNDATTPFKQRGIASWYGKKFHGKRTSSGEPYDMYKITAAHPILPIPSYARVTNLANGKQIIVRINDRGPFHSNRVMDLSYTAALKLGYIGKGSSEIEIERLLPDDIARMAENRKNQIAQTEQSPSENIASANKAVDRERYASEAVESKPSSIRGTSARSEELNSGNGRAYYLQFAAFGIRANAESSREQIQQKLRDRLGSLDLRFEIVEQGNLYRLQAGPFASRLDSQTALDKIAGLVSRPIIVQR